MTDTPTRRDLERRAARLEAKIAERMSTSERQAALIIAAGESDHSTGDGRSATDRQAAYVTRDDRDDERGRDVSTASNLSRRQAQAIVDRHRAPRNLNGWQNEEGTR